MSWALTSGPGLAPALPPIIPSPLPSWLTARGHPSEAGAEQRAEIWKRMENAGLGRQVMEEGQGWGMIAGSSTRAPALDGGIAATPCPAWRCQIRAPSLPAACTRGLTMP